MTRLEYVEAVERGEWPTDPAVPDPPAGFVDKRGAIFNLLLTDVKSVSVINSVRGALRANHWHKTDWHFTHVLNGEVLYFDRPVGSKEIGEPRRFRAGDMFFTPPNREHCMLFVSDSAIMTFARNPRDHENHESDVVRVEYVTPEVAGRFLAVGA